jgi:glycerol-3-phosphate acyltransferase PlsY
MSDLAAYLVSAGVSYLCGSIPCSLLLARWGGGIDLREHGSKNVGATNVARTMGWKWGSAALLLDALKGLVPTLAVPHLVAMPAESVPHQTVLCGLAAVIGHTAPVWLKFKGGKGVATGLGVAGVLSPWASLISFGLFALTFALKRIVSLASILASITFAVAVLAMSWPTPFSERNWSLSAFAIAVPALIVIRHASNIGRLMRGEEKPLQVEKTSDTKPQ